MWIQATAVTGLFDARVHAKKLLTANLMLFCLFFPSVDPEKMREKSSASVLMLTLTSFYSSSSAAR